MVRYLLGTFINTIIVSNAKMKFRFLILLLLSFKLINAQYKIDNVQFRFNLFINRQAFSRNNWEFRNNRGDFAQMKMPLLDSILPNLSVFKVLLWKDDCKGLSYASNFIVICENLNSNFEIFKPCSVDDSYKGLFDKFKGKKLRNSSDITTLKTVFNKFLQLLAIHYQVTISEKTDRLIFEIKDPSVINPQDLKRIEIYISDLTIIDISYN